MGKKLELAAELHAMRFRVVAIKQGLVCAGFASNSPALIAVNALWDAVERVRFEMMQAAPSEAEGVDVFHGWLGREIGQRIADNIGSTSKIAALVDLEAAWPVRHERQNSPAARPATI